jgi:hypothetical protein
MKKVLSLVGALTCGWALVGCHDVPVKNGAIDSKYSAEVSRYLGVYYGKGESRSVLNFDLDSQNRVLAWGNEAIVGTSCRPKINELKSFTILNDHAADLVFAMETSHCSEKIAGKTIRYEVRLDSKDASSVKITSVILKSRKRVPSGPHHSGPRYRNTYSKETYSRVRS